MTNLGDLLGNMADKLAQDNLNVGDVHLLNLDQKNGITPKAGDATRNKFFIILGFDNEGNVIGGLVINSNINYNLPATVTDYQLPVTVEQFSFLEHNSFINCSKNIVAKRSKFSILYLQPIITQYFIDNKSEIWLLFLIAHSKR